MEEIHTAFGLGNETTESRTEYQPGDISWMLTSTVLVFIMNPGIGMFYSGLTKSKNGLSLIMLSLAATAAVSIQWLLVGYSLTFSTKGSFFIGTFDKALYLTVGGNPSPGSNKVPELMYSLYQLMFAVVTPPIIIGSGAGRARFLPTVVFMVIWTTFVYDFISYWAWNPNGWLNVMGSLDFAGGSPVHISTGTAALAFAVVLGRRTDLHDLKAETPQNVIIGAVLIWFGWFGFNGGSALASGMRAVMAAVVTNMAASAGAITLVLLEYRHSKQFSPVAFCTGAIIGMVAITPGSGYVAPLGSVVIASVTAFICHLCMTMKHHFPIDDAADVFICHGIAGLCGNTLTGVFAQASIAALDGTVIPGGWLDGHWMQVPYQLAGSCAAMAWSFVLSLIILNVIDKIPGLKLRMESTSELEGVDKVDLGMTIFPQISNLA